MNQVLQRIAQVIYTAATDNKDQLRYMAGKDTALYFRIRKGEDQDYVNYMRKAYIPEILEEQDQL